MDNIRTVDELGRIVLPKAVREFLGVLVGDQFVIASEGSRVILSRYNPTCLACDDDTDVRKINRTYLCGECRDAVRNTL